MRWTEPQIAMLREIGVRVWAPPSFTVPTMGEAAARAVDAAAESIVAGPPPASAAAPAQSPASAPSASASASASSASPVAALGWPELRAAVADCTACRLCEGRRQTVFGIGQEHAHWMVVGEAPGEQEDLKGEPFVGKSGQLLDNMLRAIALTRAPGPPQQQVFIANAIKCRPPGNRNPQPDELAQCEAFLIRQVQLVQPRIILAMGRFAVHSLLRSTEPIGRLRGRVHHYQGVPLIVTYHPAYLLRNPEDKARAWDDLCLAVETVQATALR
ncbi:MAG: uracil-DNA glycosylase [Burkholderiales bacterium]|nr:uracil-DNA glycosylase [Burkholderiales bacterium]